MSQRPNFYHLLDLDPSVTDWATIEARLQEKKRQWSKDRTMGNPKRKREAARALDLLLEIESTLKNEETRKNEAAAERKRRKGERQRRFQELDAAIAVLKSSGGCDEVTFERLCKQFQGTFGEGEIKKRLRAAGIKIEKVGSRKKTSKRKKNERIDSSLAENIRRNLKHLGVENLYDFLDLQPQSSPEALTERAKEIYKENQRLGKTDHNASAQNELAGIGQKVFRSDAEKAKYDAHLAVEAMEGLKSGIAMAGSDGFLSLQEMDTLVRQARERGVAVEDARAYLEDIAAKRKWVIQPQAELPVEELARCGFCSALATGAKATRCPQCGKPLEMPCPQCGASNPTDHAACAKCGCRVGDAPLVHGLLDEGRRRLSAGEVQEALLRFDKALHYWPDWQPAVDARRQARKQQAAREEAFEAIEKHVRSGRLLAARSALEQCQRRFGGGGFEPLRGRFDAGVSRAEAAFRAGETKRRGGQGEAALEEYQEALAACADYEPARKALAASPPPRPGKLEIQPRNDGFRLTWQTSPARGTVSYRVLRKRGAAPRSAEDGETVGEVPGPPLDDTSADPGTAWSYAVFTVRGGVVSRTAAHAGPVLRTTDVEDLEAVAGDGEVTLTWRSPPGCQGVEVRRTKGGTPTRRGDGTSVSTSGDGAHDTGLDNGERYGYRVVALFPDPERPGEERLSRGGVVPATPVAPPEPVKDLRYERKGKTVLLTWAPPPDATVQIRQTGELPEYRPGLTLAASQASRFGLQVASSKAGSVQVILEGQGRFHFIPLTVRQGTAVVGKAVSVVTLDPCADLVSRRSGRTVALTWTWPQGIEEALVTWRHDRAPRTVEDDVVGQARVTRRQYDRAGCWELRHAERQSHHFTVFAYVPADDLHAPGVSVVEPFGHQLSLRYRVVQQRHWLHRRVQDAWIELTGEVNGLSRLPALLVVGKPKGVPVSPDDGRLLSEAKEIRFDKGTARVPIPSQHWGSGLYVKLFFQDSAQARQVRLLPAPQGELHLN